MDSIYTPYYATTGANKRLLKVAVAPDPNATPGTVNSTVYVKPPNSFGVLAVTTNGTAGTYVVFGSQACIYATVNNPSASDIRVRFNGAGEYVTIPSKGGQDFPVSNTNQIGVSLDVSATGVRVEVIWANIS